MFLPDSVLSASCVCQGLQVNVSGPYQLVPVLWTLTLVITVTDPHLYLQLLLTKIPVRCNKQISWPVLPICTCTCIMYLHNLLSSSDLNVWCVFILSIIWSYQRNGEEAGILSVCLCPSSEVRMPSLSAILVTLDKTAAKTQKQNIHIGNWETDVISQWLT